MLNQIDHFIDSRVLKHSSLLASFGLKGKSGRSRSLPVVARGHFAVSCVLVPAARDVRGWSGVGL